MPVSLKDQFNIKGFDSTLGYVGRAFQPADADAPLVQTLKQLGAVVIAKTNLPQSIMVSAPQKPSVSCKQNSSRAFCRRSGARRTTRSGASRHIPPTPSSLLVALPEAKQPCCRSGAPSLAGAPT